MGFSITGTSKVTGALRERLRKYGKKGSIVVGYSAPYATRIHEDMNMFHTVGKAHFLSDPAKIYAKDISRVIQMSLARGEDVEVALYAGGNLLLSRSKDEVPIDTGFLRDSGYVKVE